MKETRKQIIELISDYMDKSLSEGCYIDWYSNEMNINWYMKYIEHINWYYLTDINKFQLRYQRERSWGWEIGLLRIEKILWHYDITAVLKYIHKKLFIEFYNEEVIHCEDVKWNKYNIPNKPLHLYTEQEEVLLLELLKKLWN